MPHLHVKEFKEIEFPAKEGEIEFDFVADNINNDEKLIAVKVEDDRFFLLQKREEKRMLLKTDKLTRPASIYNVHKALLGYAKLAKLEIISSNVPEKLKNVHLQEVDALKKIEFFAKSFPQEREVHIEVGFGSGRHLLHQAANNSDILFIGIEIHRPSIEQVLKQVAIQKLDNLLVLDYDARLFLELVPSNLVGKIYVHFPVPWDKKPHRRVISTKFIEESRRVLKVDGRLELRTDSEKYYAYSYETFIAFNKTVLQINKNKDIAVSSKYEDRWKKMEKNIYDLTMINEEKSQPLSIEGNFTFTTKKQYNFDKLVKLHTFTKRFDGGFIHFERVYKVDDTAVLIRISMGSFDRPEHLYIVVKKEHVEYYPQLPLRSKSNLLAHKYLNEVLHG